DLSGNISNYNSREGTFGGGNLIQTSDGNFLFGTSYKDGNNYDVYLYKLDSNLQSVPFDNNTYNYDSLCPDPIQSGYISLEDCSIITSIDDASSPEEYYTSLKTIPISTFPNPAKDKITFALENTDKHHNIKLACYDVFGRKVHEQKIYTGQLEAEAHISGWGNGIYVAVVKSQGEIVGRTKFIVE
ncbi:MAG: T9SS type A sorting domain-containing protein, partial [Bacteroidales bacterium]|nr:T9SS type A sorting domain-containing protein [Bacteroidales bacterium]